MRQPTSHAIKAAPRDAGEQRPATGDQPDLGLICPHCRGEGHTDGKSITIGVYDFGEVECMGCDRELSTAGAIALWSKRRGRLAEGQVRAWGRFAHLVALARRPTPTPTPTLDARARRKLRAATIRLRDAIAAVNATEGADDDDGDDGRAYEAQCRAEKAFVAVAREHGVEGTIMGGRIYAGFGADVARVEVLQDSYVLDMATVVFLD